jgi:hypothetical protein
MNPSNRPLALATGASSGIGLELVRLLASDGHDLVLVARSGERLRELAREFESAHGAKSIVIAEDLSDPGAPARLAERVQRDGLSLDVLINNAGFGLGGAFLESDWNAERNMVLVNVLALTELTKRLLPAMAARKKGRILNVASTAGFVAGPKMAVYYATKAYVLSFSEALAEELAGSGVTVTTLCPGPTETGFARTAKMTASRLFRMRPPATALSVAKEGYAGMKAGRRLVITGFLNKLMVQSLRVSPRVAAIKLAAWLQGGAGH